MIQLANWLIITNSNNQLFILIILRYIPYQQYFNILYSLVLFLDLFSTYFFSEAYVHPPFRPPIPIPNPMHLHL